MAQDHRPALAETQEWVEGWLRGLAGIAAETAQNAKLRTYIVNETATDKL